MKPGACAAALLATITACGSSGDPGATGAPGNNDAAAAGDSAATGTDGSDYDFVPCTNDARVDHYAAGMEKSGSNGLYKVKLLASQPAPPAKPNDVWNLAVSDVNGAPASGLTVVVSPYMPDHRHPPPVTPVVTALAEPGRYDVAMINLFMAGVWQVKVSLSGAGASDAVTFWFCVER
jgi:hypothetical protein